MCACVSGHMMMDGGMGASVDSSCNNTVDNQHLDGDDDDGAPTTGSS